MNLDKLLSLIPFLFFIFSSKGNNTEFQLIEIKNSYNKPFVLSNLPLISTDLYTNFPYETYIQHMNYSDVKQLNKHIEELQLITQNEFLTKSIFSLCFTSKLKKLQTEDLDSLYSVLLWADKIYENALLEGKNKDFYQSIPSFWYNYTSNTLSKINIKKDNIKFSFKYQYLIQKCAEKGYFTQGQISLTEKFILNVLEKKWTYLFYRFWNNTSLLLKTLLFSILFLTLILVYFGIKYILIFQKKKPIHNNKLINL